MVDDLDAKAVNLTTFIFKIPPYRTILFYLLVSSAAFGVFAYSLQGPSVEQSPVARALGLSEPLIVGASEGLFLFAFPAVVSAVLAASLLSRKTFRQAIKYFLFTALLSQFLTGIIYVAGLAAVSGLFVHLAFVVFVVLLAAAEAAVALAIVLALFRRMGTVEVDRLDSLRE